MFLIFICANEFKFLLTSLIIQTRTDHYLTGVLAFITLGLLGLTWPGVISVDDFFLMDHLNTMNWIHTFSGSFYSGLMNLLLQLNGEVYFLNILQTVLYISLFCKILYLINFLTTSESNKKRKLIKYFALVFFVFPLNLSFVIFQNRDALFSIFFGHMIFYIFLSLYDRTNAFSIKNKYFYFLLLCLFTLSLRQDAVFNLITVPFLLSLLKIVPLQTKWKHTALYITTAILLSIPSLTQSPDAQGYKITTVVNPLSYIINKHGLGSLSTEEIKGVEKVFRLDFLVRYYSPLEINPFHEGGLISTATSEDFDKFYEICYSLFFRYKFDYLKNRVNVFLHGINLLETNYIWSDGLSKMNTTFNLENNYFLSPFRSQAVQLMSEITQSTSVINWIPRILFFNIAPYFVVFLFFLFNFKNFKPEFIISSWIFFRLPILFFFEPASIFKYYYSIYLCFIFLITHLYFRRVRAADGFYESLTRSS